MANGDRSGIIGVYRAVFVHGKRITLVEKPYDLNLSRKKRTNACRRSDR